MWLWIEILHVWYKTQENTYIKYYKKKSAIKGNYVNDGSYGFYGNNLMSPTDLRQISSRFTLTFDNEHNFEKQILYASFFGTDVIEQNYLK